MQLKKRVLKICRVGIFAALLAIAAMIHIPFPIPVTLQSFVLFILAGILCPSEALSATAVYLLLGCLGLPIFSAFSGGIGTLLGPGGGFLMGFIPVVLLCSYFNQKSHSLLYRYIVAILGMLVLYVGGAGWYALTYAKHSVMANCILPFLLPDAIKIALAVPIALRLSKMLRLKTK